MAWPARRPWRWRRSWSGAPPMQAGRSSSGSSVASPTRRPMENRRRSGSNRKLKSMASNNSRAASSMPRRRSASAPRRTTHTGASSPALTDNCARSRAWLAISACSAARPRQDIAESVAAALLRQCAGNVQQRGREGMQLTPARFPLRPRRGFIAEQFDSMSASVSCSCRRLTVWRAAVVGHLEQRIAQQRSPSLRGRADRSGRNSGCAGSSAAGLRQHQQGRRPGCRCPPRRRIAGSSGRSSRVSYQL